MRESPKIRDTKEEDNESEGDAKADADEKL
jgi:hypothetical protein